MVKGTYRIIQNPRTKKYRVVDEKGHGVDLGTTKLRQAKKRSPVAIEKMERTNGPGSRKNR